MNNLAIFTVLNFPTRHDFFQILDVLESRKISFVEIGIPTIDPFMDGRLIRGAHAKVITEGLRNSELLETLKIIKEKYSFKIILMTYKQGLKFFEINKLDHTLYDGIICVDEVLNSTVYNKPIYIFNENLTEKDIKKYLNSESEFNYVMSGRGETGSFDLVPVEYIATIKKIKEVNPMSINYVGFGIQNKEDIKKVIENGADGAIIGSAFLDKFLNEGIIGISSYLDSLI